MINDAKSRRDIFKHFVDEWADQKDDMTELDDAIWKAGAYNGSGLKQMKDAKGKIKGTGFPFEPSQF